MEFRDLNNKYSPMYDSVFFQRVLNQFIKHGKKERIEIGFYRMFGRWGSFTSVPPIFYIFEIAEKQRPIIGSRRVILRRRPVTIPTK
jgi:hypothetical protein